VCPWLTPIVYLRAGQRREAALSRSDAAGSSVRGSPGRLTPFFLSTTGCRRGHDPGACEALERYFKGARGLRVQIDKVEVAVFGDEAVVTYTRTDDPRMP
jgi:hypothetical protein